MEWSEDWCASTRQALRSLGNREWVVTMCALLSKTRPRTEPLAAVVGGRGSPPLDPRFSHVAVEGADVVDRLIVSGREFCVRPRNFTDEMPLHEAGHNTWDGGMFFFFYPLSDGPNRLGAVTLDVDDDDVDWAHPERSVSRRVVFQFGKRVVRYRDGWSLGE